MLGNLGQLVAIIVLFVLVVRQHRRLGLVEREFRILRGLLSEGAPATDASAARRTRPAVRRMTPAVDGRRLPDPAQDSASSGRPAASASVDEPAATSGPWSRPQAASASEDLAPEARKPVL